MSKTLNDRIELRIHDEHKAKFISECKEMGKPYQIVLRELIVAFNEDKLRINKRRYRELYKETE